MDVVYFELNNWMPGEHYPNEEPFLTWLKNDFDLYFLNHDWVEKNELCVVASHVDMSVNFCITAKREWVEENCPRLLTEYTQFLRKPDEDDEDGIVYGQFGHEFLPYEECYIGISFATDEDEDIFWGDEDEEYEDEEYEDEEYEDEEYEEYEEYDEEYDDEDEWEE